MTLILPILATVATVFLALHFAAVTVNSLGGRASDRPFVPAAAFVVGGIAGLMMVLIIWQVWS